MKVKDIYFHVKMSAEVLTSNIMNNCASIPVEIELCHLTRLLGGPQYSLKLQKEEAMVLNIFHLIV